MQGLAQLGSERCIAQDRAERASVSVDERCSACATARQLHASQKLVHITAAGMREPTHV